MRTLVITCAAALMLGASALSGCAAKPATFSNPIVDVGQDPYMSQWHDRYLLTEERNDNEIWIRESRPDDLTGIASRGSSHRVWVTPSSGSHCTDVWAPELHHIGDRWFIYYSATTCDGNNSGHRMFALESTTDDPLGRYTDRGEVKTPSGGWAIDGTEFEWDHQRYFAWSGWPDSSGSQQVLFIARMTAPTTLAARSVVISRPTLAWERIGAPIEEGPESLAHDGRLFLVYSASGSWTDHYAYGMLRLAGSNPLDPSDWRKSSTPVFASGHGVYAPGHGSFVRSPDGTQYWMIYHSAIAEGSGWDREIDAQQYSWTSNGAPDFGTPAAQTLALTVPSGQR